MKNIKNSLILAVSALAIGGFVNSDDVKYSILRNHGL